MANEPGREDLQYIVGAEKRLREIITADEALPLLRGVLAAGARQAAVRDDAGEVLWQQGEGRPEAAMVSRTLVLEGEPVGSAAVSGDREQLPFLNGLAALLTAILNGLLTSNLKRMLTTEIHTVVVRQSYEELLESNRKLAASEARYRELAGRLEEKVVERTKEIERLHLHLLQQEKMAAIGQLAAGMAHEINNPLGFVVSNLTSLAQYVGRLEKMLLAFRDAAAGKGSFSEASGELGNLWRQLKIEFILEDLEGLFHQTREGCDRIRAIVADLKGFSHIDEGEKGLVDLNQELDRTLKVLAGQLAPETKVHRDYRPLPLFEGQPARLAQVFLNVMLNAAQARPSGLELTLRTRSDGHAILVAIADNGPGLAPGVRDRVFEPFFTTREVGMGKGLGLSAAYEIIRACGGRISLDNRPEGGAEVVISLPLPEGKASRMPEGRAGAGTSPGDGFCGADGMER